MVKSVEVKTKGNKVNLYCVGDLHIGAKAFRKDAFQKLMDMIKKDKHAAVLLMGDHCDLITEDDTRRYDATTIDPKTNTVEKQMDLFWDYIEPISDKIIGVLRGNHEATYAKYHADEFDDTCRDFAEEIASLSGANYLEDLGVIKLNVGGKINHTFNIIATHGMGGSATLAGQVKNLSKIIDNFEFRPDISVMGHVHALQSILDPKMTYKFKTRMKHLGLTGTFLKTYTEGQMNYASGCNYSPLAIGCLMYELDNTGMIVDKKIIFE